MEEYDDKEIELAKRIHNATLLVSGGTTVRKARNYAKKFGFPVPDESPDVYFLETARDLLRHYEEELEKVIQEVVEKL